MKIFIKVTRSNGIFITFFLFVTYIKPLTSTLVSKTSSEKWKEIPLIFYFINLNSGLSSKLFFPWWFNRLRNFTADIKHFKKGVDNANSRCKLSTYEPQLKRKFLFFYYCINFITYSLKNNSDFRWRIFLGFRICFKYICFHFMMFSNVNIFKKLLVILTLRFQSIYIFYFSFDRFVYS